MFLLLNNDTTVESDFLKNMVEAAKNGRDVGIVNWKNTLFLTAGLHMVWRRIL